MFYTKKEFANNLKLRMQLSFIDRKIDQTYLQLAKLQQKREETFNNILP